MLAIKKIECLDDVSQLKTQYFAQSTAPLDGMWHFGFAPLSTHFGFYENHCLVGYCCINSDGYLLQFYLSPTANIQSTRLFTMIAQQQCAEIGPSNGAFVSTAESDYLSLCFDNSSSFKVNALMYQQHRSQNVEAMKQLELELVLPDQLAILIDFAASNIGAPEQWLLGYYANLIQRQELWGYWKNGKLLATGECRLFDDHQQEYADLGMIVAVNERGKGIATRVLIALINKAKAQGLKPICSTEYDNIGAQKAITRAGLVASNRIIQFTFGRS